jgi:hypothetical protein
MNSEEYEAVMKEYDEKLAVVDQPPAGQQLFATMTELAGDATTTASPNLEVEEGAGAKQDKLMDDTAVEPYHPP